MMLRDDVVDEGYHNIQSEQHQQPLTNEEGDRPKARNEVSHDRTVYTLEIKP